MCGLDLAELALRSQVVQRGGARPRDVNASVLRPRGTGATLTPLQRAEELLKAEMITMLHYDALHDPLPSTYMGLYFYIIFQLSMRRNFAKVLEK